MSTINVNQMADSQGGVLAPISSVMRNRIINGAMTIDQRNAGASVTPTDNQYTIDRWVARVSQASKYTVQQNAGSVTPPPGFNNYLGVTVISAATIGAGDAFDLQHRIEGYNVADLDWGTANAKTVTLSFWVRSSLTGTFGGVVQNNSFNRSYPFSYSIPSANTWTQISITITGDTGGTWTKTNGSSIVLSFGLGNGSNFEGTAGAWAAAGLLNATGTVDVVATNGATFYITGVQLEKGTQATSFEYRQYGTELTLCQRYFERSGTGGSQTIALAAGSRMPAYFAVSKRAAPTVTYTFVAGDNVVTLDSPTTSGFRINTSGSVGAPCDFTWTAAIEL